MSAAEELEPEVIWRPNPGPQEDFLACGAQDVLYGGAAGGGKSAASIAMPLRYVHNGRYRALFLRREAKYLADAIEKSMALYPHYGAKIVMSPKIIWTFPSGATVWLNHCEHESDIANYDSLAFNDAIFEELTHFTERQYRGIRARLRTTDPTLPTQSRSTTNPGGPGHDWVFKRWGAWLDPEHPDPARAGESRFYVGDREVPRGTPDALSRTFIPAKLSDNPHITNAYRAQLLDLDPVRSEQLLEGNWLAKPAAGKYFQRAWFKVIEALPSSRMATVRYWDRAALPPGEGGDWTVGAKMVRLGPNPYDLDYVVVDVRRMQGGPGEVEAELKATAALDGRGVTQVLEHDPGQAGIVEMRALRRALSGFPVRAFRKGGNKIVKAGPFSAQVKAGNVGILYPGGVAPPWVRDFFPELEAFPDINHEHPAGKWDDQVDAASGAFNFFTRPDRAGDGDEIAVTGGRRDMEGYG